MKWFFAFNADSPNFAEYRDMIKVAVLTARRHTRLEPCCLYDGGGDELTRWLAGQGVTIVPHRWRLLDAFNRAAQESGKTQLLGYAAGIFLRIDIPAICAERGWADEEVLYTDCDVMFTGDPEPLFPSLRGAFLGAGAESDRSDLLNFNSGVMVMRLPSLQAVDGSFQEFIRRNLAVCAEYTDQLAYQVFFRHGTRPLPPELNWKPYWGENAEARIVHFHAAKPFVRAALAAGRGTDAQRRFSGGAFQHYCQVWDQELDGG